MRKYLLLLMISLVTLSCTEIFEPDLDEEEIEIYLPADGTITSLSTVQFWWEKIEGVEKYEIRIVSPEWDDFDQLIHLSSQDTNYLELSLVPGNYAWGVKAWNATTETKFSLGTFTIDSTLDLTGQKVVLIEPVGDTTNQLSRFYDWQELYNADEYRCVWEDMNGITLKDTTVTQPGIVFETVTEGDIAWKVKALNAQSQSGFSQATFYLDTTRPVTPVLLLPMDQAVVNNDTVTFTWSRASGSGASEFDTLFVSTSPLFDTGLQKYRSSAKNTRITGFSAGTYYWRVKAFDRAGNEGDFSATREFDIP